MTSEIFSPQLPQRNRPGLGLVVLAGLFIFLSALLAILGSLLGRTGLDTVRMMRLMALLQDVFVFIVPALGAALVATRRPAEMLGVMQKPPRAAVAAMILVLVFSIPFMEAVIYWNYHLDLSFLGEKLLDIAREMEDASAGAVTTLLGDTSVGALLVNILIVGVAAGFSEELFFRGGLQRLFRAMGLNPHVAIWLVAVIFSGMHLQFYGFVPRMLLGAFFGYLLYWSRSLWLPVTAHILNNTAYVVTSWVQARATGRAPSASEAPELWSMWITAGSFIVTASLLFLLWKLCVNKR